MFARSDSWSQLYWSDQFDWFSWMISNWFGYVIDHSQIPASCFECVWPFQEGLILMHCISLSYQLASGLPISMLSNRNKWAKCLLTECRFITSLWPVTFSWTSASMSPILTQKVSAAESLHWTVSCLLFLDIIRPKTPWTHPMGHGGLNFLKGDPFFPLFRVFTCVCYGDVPEWCSEGGG